MSLVRVMLPAEWIHEGYVFCMVPQVVTLPRFSKWHLVFGILEDDLVAKVGGMTPHKMKRLWEFSQPFNLASEAFGTWCSRLSSTAAGLVGERKPYAGSWSWTH